MSEIIAPMTVPCRPVDAPESQARKGKSRLANDAALLPGLKGNTAEYRRYKDLLTSYLNDVGGLEACSEVKLGLLRTLAGTTIRLEALLSQVANGEQIDTAELCTLASTQLRIATRVKIERKEEPSSGFGALLRAHHSKQPEADQ